MDNNDTRLIMEHLEDNGELKNLWDEHLALERQLDKINRKPYLSPQEKVEKKRIQLAKLAGKTKIETILTDYRHSSP